MATQSYSLRSRLGGQPPSMRTTPTGSPLPKAASRSPRKPHAGNVSLHLKKVIGTTTSGPTGLACCVSTNTYAYCAGAVAVLARVGDDGTAICRYYKSRPTAAAMNPSRSYYDNSSPSVTPSRRRTTIFSVRKVGATEVTAIQGKDWADDGNNNQTWTARERIKAVTCVALSINGKWMAVGESGYNPRVLLYSTSLDALTSVPTSIVSDHAFAVRSVAFSPDSRYLATLGNLNDGFLYIWSLDQRTGALTLNSANKCTTSISDMIWCGQSLVTVGTRHVKVWQPGQMSKPIPSRRFSLRGAIDAPASPGPATLLGRNALLGSLVDCNFTSAVAVGDSLVLIGTDGGHLCGLEMGDASPELRTLKVLHFEITSLSYQHSQDRVVLGARQGIIYEDLAELRRQLDLAITSNAPHLTRSPRKGRRSSNIRQSLGVQALTSTGVSAVGSLTNYLVALDSNGDLQVASTEDDNTQGLKPEFASHNDMIQGVSTLPNDSQLGSFVTWTRHGDVKFWDTGGRMTNQVYVRVEQQDFEGGDTQNELKIVKPLLNSACYVTGDRFGVLQLISSADWQTVWTGRAHGAEVTDIAVASEDSLIATSSRDQTVQLFAGKENSFEIVQTMDDHIGAVNSVLFAGPKDSKLLSCSADRTVIIREKAERDVGGGHLTAFISAKVVTLRSAPLSMTFASATSELLIVSTMDRHVLKVEVNTGTVAETCKVTDPENDDTVALSSIAVSRKGSMPDDHFDLLIGFSSTDKSLRVYDAEKTLLLTRESGHTEGISDLCVLEDRESDHIERTVVTTGLDGTIMLWTISTAIPLLATPANELSQTQLFQNSVGDTTPVKASPASLPPLRKVLSKIDILEFSKSNGLRSPSSPRSLSPARLVRKKSNLALTSTINEQDEGSVAGLQVDRRRSDTVFDAERSPSPPPSALTRPKKQRSRSEIADPETKRACSRRSPSPPPLPSSQPTTPRHRTAANNSRLRRPPSVPTDLRGQALAQGRRQSMTQVSDFGSLSMATEQACRMLRTYRKKLATSKEEPNLNELEDELEMIMKIVKDKKEKSTRPGSSRRVKAATENDVDELAVLLEKSNMEEVSSAHRDGRVKA